GQRFVDKIRAQGGNNTKRFLLIPGYSTDITRTTMASYVMPIDNTNPDVQKTFNFSSLLHSSNILYSF
ncbi:MAG: hypothetical protein IKY10_04560, partial [Clostridia bacterium]|nr:hypothetical protein [Clostridia bacterium]